MADGSGPLLIDELDQVGREVESTWQHLSSHDRARPEKFMAFGRALLKARRACTSAGKGGDKAFGEWLANRGLTKNVLTHQRRAALINLAEAYDANRPGVREIIDNTTRTSERQLWDKDVWPRIQRTNAEAASANAKTEQAAVCVPYEPVEPEYPNWERAKIAELDQDEAPAPSIDQKQVEPKPQAEYDADIAKLEEIKQWLRHLGDGRFSRRYEVMCANASGEKPVDPRYDLMCIQALITKLGNTL